MADSNQFEGSGENPVHEYSSAFQEKFNDLHSQGEDYVRTNPTQAFLSALGIGFVLQLLPIGALIGALVRLVFFALRPAIFIYGAVTLYKQYKQTQEENH